MVWVCIEYKVGICLKRSLAYEYARNGNLQKYFLLLNFKKSHFLNYVIFHGPPWVVVSEGFLDPEI